MAKINNLLLIKLVKSLSIDFKDTKAFKLGIIDSKGKILKRQSQLSVVEKTAFGRSDIFVNNIKKIIRRRPGMNSRISKVILITLLLKEDRDMSLVKVKEIIEKINISKKP